jgi:hypothetical protein
MEQLTLILSGNKNSFTTFMNPPIHLDKNAKYEAALLSIDMYYSFPNITNENNNFTYSTDNGKTWKTILLDKGSYELKAINNEIQRQLISNGDYNQETNENYISITANVSKLKSIVHISHNEYLIDFNIPNSIGSTLGFNPSRISHGYNESHKIVDIMKINSILVNIDIISGSYVNGIQHPVIYSFFPNVAPGSKIVERPNPSLTYYPVTRTTIDRVTIVLTDQNNKPIDLRGEIVTVRVAIREQKNLKNTIKKAIKELKNENII